MCVGGGEGGAIFEPQTFSMYLKKEQKKTTEPGFKPTTSGLKKPALLSTRLNTFIGITKYERENYNIRTAIIQKNHIFVFKNSPDNHLIVLYKLIKVTSLYL